MKLISWEDVKTIPKMIVGLIAFAMVIVLITIGESLKYFLIWLIRMRIKYLERKNKR